MGIAAYKQTIKTTANPKDIEHRLLQKATTRLSEHKDVTSFLDITQDMREALWENQRLWHTLRMDIAQPENSLPKELRAHLLSLSAFVDRHTVEVLRGKATTEPLIDINKAIMQGLKPAPAANANQ